MHNKISGDVKTDKYIKQNGTIQYIFLNCSNVIKNWISVKVNNFMSSKNVDKEVQRKEYLVFISHIYNSQLL